MYRGVVTLQAQTSIVYEPVRPVNHSYNTRSCWSS